MVERLYADVMDDFVEWFSTEYTDSEPLPLPEPLPLSLPSVSTSLEGFDLRAEPPKAPQASTEPSIKPPAPPAPEEGMWVNGVLVPFMDCPSCGGDCMRYTDKVWEI